MVNWFSKDNVGASTLINHKRRGPSRLCRFFWFWFWFVLLLTWSHYTAWAGLELPVDQAGQKLTMMGLPPSPQCWGHRCMPPCQARSEVFTSWNTCANLRPLILWTHQGGREAKEKEAPSKFFPEGKNFTNAHPSKDKPKQSSSPARVDGAARDGHKSGTRVPSPEPPWRWMRTNCTVVPPPCMYDEHYHTGAIGCVCVCVLALSPHNNNFLKQLKQLGMVAHTFWQRQKDFCWDWGQVWLTEWGPVSKPEQVSPAYAPFVGKSRQQIHNYHLKLCSHQLGIFKKYFQLVWVYTYSEAKNKKKTTWYS